MNATPAIKNNTTPSSKKFAAILFGLCPFIFYIVCIDFI
jgi:hypothetical protein